MDYKAKYEEALERAKNELQQDLHESGIGAIKRIFPELRESDDDDERIRKFLINLVSTMNWRVGWPEDRVKEEKVKCLAWLEKQKDASKAIEAVERIDRYITEHTANSWEMDDSNPDKKYYCGVDDTLSNIAGILQGVYAKQKEQMMKDAIDGECIDDTTAGVEIDTKYGVLFLPPHTFRYEDKLKIIIVKEEDEKQ